MKAFAAEYRGTSGFEMKDEVTGSHGIVTAKPGGGGAPRGSGGAAEVFSDLNLRFQYV